MSARLRRPLCSLRNQSFVTTTGPLALETQEKMPLTSPSVTPLQNLNKALSPLRLCADCVPASGQEVSYGPESWATLFMRTAHMVSGRFSRSRTGKQNAEVLQQSDPWFIPRGEDLSEHKTARTTDQRSAAAGCEQSQGQGINLHQRKWMGK
jgi:hypothetical protein